MTKKQSKVMRSFQIRMITQLSQGTFSSIDLKNEFFVKWLVGYMADNQIPFQLIPLGAGVTRILLAGCVCEHCKGKGFIAEKADTLPKPHLMSALEKELADEEAQTAHCGDHCSCENGCAGGGICCSQQHRAA
ncbi:hypothetical protein LZ24_02859 [Desulfobotulus alkaliphilus]|uniref:Uncharacterized protein n=1 Tax=Desulfobotulus alkaliphilus TaxID=622671 RepID=A0A562RCZ3_9BACT|nr:hypothetical protein [Desulfobotulus alkaliphilus]TWI66902.1 hypothetical protein LZ24_02859 [Desulfobotulus alkaliphilus]